MMPVALPAGVLLRPIMPSDAPALHDAMVRNRPRLRRSSPAQPEAFWTPEGQRERVGKAVARNAAGEALVCVLVREAAIVGMTSLTNIVRGAFGNASIGYWVDGAFEGRGLTTAAVGAACALADERLGLHRVEASTLPDNEASQRVLLKNGFERIGEARDYLYLDGAWRSAALFQRILNDREPRDG